MRPPGAARRAAASTLAGVALAIALAGPAPLAAQGAPAGPARGEEGAWPRRVLITNDDGIDSAPTRALARAFAHVTETWVVAPRENRSGSASYLSVLSQGRLEVEPVDLGEGITAYAVDGYPGDAVAFALLGPMRDRPPDLVVSGINDGSNLAGAWFLSGTVGGARVAAFLGVPALAVSGVEGEDPEAVRTVAEWVVSLARSAPVRRLEPREYLTVSLPVREPRFIRGPELVRRADGFVRLEASPLEAGDPEGGGGGGAEPGGREAWSVSLSTERPEETEGTDFGAIAEGRIAVVGMRVGEEYAALRSRLETLADSLPAWPPR